jgi:hypothetical protein
MSNPYLQPVVSVWTRIVGLVLLLAASGVAAVLVRGLIGLAMHQGARRQLTSSSVIFTLILLALGGVCAQAGFRLTFNRPDRNGTLFSRAGWFAMGTGLVAMAGLMTFAIVSVRQPTGNDVLTVTVLSAFGVWCFVLAFRHQDRMAKANDE